MARSEDGKVFFDEEEQKEVDRILGERLARAKTEKPADYDDLKEIAEEINDFFPGATPSERKAAIKAYKEQIKQQEELENLQKEADEDGISPALAKKIKELESKLETKTKELDEIIGERQAKKTEEENKRKAEESWNDQVKEFNEEYPNVDLEELDKNPKFLKFVKGKNLTLKELYEDFVEFVGETEIETLVKVKSKEERSTSGGKGGNPGGNYGLTEQQKTTVDEWNRKNPNMKMSYKEFAERM